MLSVTSLRTGNSYEEDGNIFEVLSYEHIKMGRGSANVKLKVRNLRTGANTEKSFISNAQVNEIFLEKRKLQYLYKEADTACFMEPATFEQFSIPLKLLTGYEFLKEGEIVEIKFFEDEPLGLILPSKMTLRVVDAAPNVKGNSASNVYKEAVLENGIKVKVPLFVNSGDSIIVDTRDYSYTKRA